MKIKGFVLVELAIVLVIIGLIAASAIALLKPTQQFQKKLVTQASLVRVSNALINFAINNHRLPCPDTDTPSNGYEDCGAGAVTGAVPFNTLMMEVGASVANSDSAEMNMVYGVYASLTILQENTGDVVGMDYFESKDDLVAALRAAIVQTATPNASNPYLTGDGTQSGNEDCGANNQGNVAFVVVSAGGEDRSGNGNAFDGVNEGLLQNGAGSTCFSAVSRSEDTNYDDGVIAMDFNSFLGHVIN